MGRYSEPMSTNAAADFPMISAAEQLRRSNAVRQAEASNRLEGGTAHPDRSRLHADYVAGRIDLETYLARGRRIALAAANATRR